MTDHPNERPTDSDFYREMMAALGEASPRALAMAHDRRVANDFAVAFRHGHTIGAAIRKADEIHQRTGASRSEAFRLAETYACRRTLLAPIPSLDLDDIIEIAATLDRFIENGLVPVDGPDAPPEREVTRHRTSLSIFGGNGCLSGSENTQPPPSPERPQGGPG